jgi:predicted PurR-regulated permease PerM
VAVIPPVLFGLVQFQSIPMALLVLLGVGGVQLIMGQYIDPLLQGKYLALSPLVVLLSVTFWGWLWGIGGAFLGVPLTIGVVITCRRFARTRWIATLLARLEDAPDKDGQGAP